MEIYIAVSAVFAGWAMGFFAADNNRTLESERAWIAELSIALAFAAFWPLVLIGVVLFMGIKHRGI